MDQRRRVLSSPGVATQRRSGEIAILSTTPLSQEKVRLLGGPWRAGGARSFRPAFHGAKNVSALSFR